MQTNINWNFKRAYRERGYTLQELASRTGITMSGCSGSEIQLMHIDGRLSPEEEKWFQTRSVPQRYANLDWMR